MTGLSQSDAENTMRQYFSTYRDLDAYLRNAGSSVIEDRTARTGSERLLKLRFDGSNRQEVVFRLLTEFGIKLPDTVEFRDAEIDMDG